MKHKLSGTGVALVTPFQENGEVDFEALGNLVNYVTKNGVNYLVVLGTTAETPTLTATEKEKIVAFVIEKNAGKLPIVLGIGGNNTSEVVNSIKNTNLNGINAILSVTPYYNKPTQQGLYEHYKAIAQNSPLPIILYNVPGRTGVNMNAETTLRLAHEFSNIIGIKDASANLSQASYILRDKPEDFLLISGEDGLTMPQVAMGFDGVISVAANSFPAEMSEMVKLSLHGNCEKASKLHLKLIEPIDLLFAEGNPTGVKAMLAIRGIIKNHLRLPLIPSSEILYKKLEKYN